MSATLRWTWPMRTPASIGLAKMAAPSASLATSKLADMEVSLSLNAIMRQKCSNSKGAPPPEFVSQTKEPALAGGLFLCRLRRLRPSRQSDLLIADLAVVALLPDVPDIV